MMPEKSGKPQARAIPRHRGRATRNTTIPDLKSANKFFEVMFKFFDVVNYRATALGADPVQLKKLNFWRGGVDLTYRRQVGGIFDIEQVGGHEPVKAGKMLVIK